MTHYVTYKCKNCLVNCIYFYELPEHRTVADFKAPNHCIYDDGPTSNWLRETGGSF